MGSAPMITAAIKWEAVVAVASGVGVIISLVVAWTAHSTATTAKAQAEAAEAQAEAAARQTEIAEREHARATEPRLRIARYPDGGAAIHDRVPSVVVGGDEIEPPNWLRLEIENIRSASADIDQVLVNDQRSDLRVAGCEKDSPAKADIGVEHLDPERGSHKVIVRYHARDTGQPAILTATVRRTVGGWRVKDEHNCQPSLISGN
jgi:hypothetical protein